MKSMIIKEIKWEFGINKIGGEKLERINFYKLCGYLKQMREGKVVK